MFIFKKMKWPLFFLILWMFMNVYDVYVRKHDKWPLQILWTVALPGI